MNVKSCGFGKRRGCNFLRTKKEDKTFLLEYISVQPAMRNRIEFLFLDMCAMSLSIFAVKF